MRISDLQKRDSERSRLRSKARQLACGRQRYRRVLRVEMLEARQMLAAAVWHNILQPLNTTGDSARSVDPLDVLVVINEINSPKFSNEFGALPSTIPEGLEHPYFDVDCDSYVSPLDVLNVINALNSGKLGPNWSFDNNNSSSLACGHIDNNGCSPEIIEGDSLYTELSQRFVLPHANSAIRVAFEAPRFDTATVNSIRDAFEILLLDTNGQPVALPYAANRDAAFNWSEDVNPVGGVNTRITTAPSGSISTAVFNMAGLPQGTSVNVIARLVNNDQDTTSSVIIKGVEILPSTEPATSGMSVPSSSRPSFAYVDPNTLSDVSSSVAPLYGRTTLDEQNGVLVTEVQIKNQGAAAISGRMLLVVGQLSDPAISVLRPDGFLEGGRAYFVVNGTSGSGWLATGQSTAIQELRFNNPSRSQFTYALTVLAERNSAPSGFTSAPLREIEAGKTYESIVQASDPELQPLTYSIVAGPSGMTIDANSGRIQWVTSSNDIGNHTILLRATDPFEASVDQSYSIRVFENLQNRPPIFISAPHTDAKVAGAFEVTTLNVGQEPVAISGVNLGSGPMSIVTANAGDANLTLNLVTGTHYVPETLSIGEPPPSGRAMRAGVGVDVGLAPLQYSGDGNQLDGLAQADFNGDGSLDFATINYQSMSASGTDERFVSIMINRGDGSFASPIKLPIHANAGFEYDRPTGNLIARDFDGDGRVDLLANTYRPSNFNIERKFYFWPGQGDGDFGSLQVNDPGVAISNMLPGDFNNDQQLDLLVTIANSTQVGIMLGNGNGTFSDYSEFVSNPSAGYYSNNFVADIDGVNGPDVVLGNYLQRRLEVFLNDGSGNLTPSALLPTYHPFYPYGPDTNATEEPFAVWVGEFSGDGLADIVYSPRNGGTNGGGLGIWKGTGDGATFHYAPAAQQFSTLGINYASDHAPTDLNGDGHLDVVLGHTEGNYGVTVALGNGDGTFATQTYQTASDASSNSGNTTGEYHLLTGDYNKDGVLDISVANSRRAYFSNSIAAGLTILFGESAGSFAAPRDLYTGALSTQIVNLLGDVNNDGNLDMIVGDGSRFLTNLGNGDGTFQTPQIATPSFYSNDPHFASLVDLDHDGKLDLLWARDQGYQGASQGYMAALGNGDGTFSVTFNTSVPGSFYGAVMIPPADYNGDGYLDFAAHFGSAYAVGTSIDVWLYNPSVPGTFTQSYRYTYSSAESGYNGDAISGTLATADFDGDEIYDLLAVPKLSDDGTPRRIHFFRGRGDGTFDDPTVQPVFTINSDIASGGGNWTPKWTEVGDLNEDGKMDFVLTSSYSRAAIFLGNGDGTFETPREYATGTFFASERQPYLQDIDQDGHLDLVTIDDTQSRNVIAIRRGYGDGRFESEERYNTGGRSAFLAFGDVDNDGVIDMLSSSPNSTSYSTLFIGANPGLTGLTSGDVNGDGRIDILAANSVNNRVKVLQRRMDGTLARQNDLIVGRNPIAIAALDLDGDLLLDIVTANRAGRSVSVLSNNGTGGFTRSDIAVGSLLTALTTGDLEKDGWADIVVASEEANALFVISNTPSGFTTPLAIPVGDVPGQLAVGDGTGDGINDVIVSLPRSNRLMILPGKGNGSFDVPLFVTLTSAAGGLGIADFNQDGTSDLAITLPGMDQAAILFGRGHGRFARPQSIAVGDNPTSLAIEDLNADGRPDLLVTNRDDGTASLIINRYDASKLYRYSPYAMDPDGDAVQFDLSNSPGGMLMNETTGEIVWAPTVDQTGLNSVTISASDGRGGIATQSFRIDVQPNRDNAPPVIFSDPPEVLEASNVYSYTPSALDANGDTIRYRLIDAPAGAAIDPTTGKLEWDPRQDALRMNTNRNGNSYVTVPDRPTLRPTSLTVEGFFRMDQVGTNQTFFNKPFYNPYPYSVSSFSLRSLHGQLRGSISGINANNEIGEAYVATPWAPESGRWYHLALTYDDITGALRVFVDGQLFEELLTNRHVVYDSQDLTIGYTSGDPLLGSASQFRIWDRAKTQEEIQTGLIQPATPNATGVLLDYRFDDGDSITVRDHSNYAHHGRRLSNAYGFPVPTRGLSTEQTQDFLIQVEDGKGGVASQSFQVTVVPPWKQSIAGSLFEDLDGNGVRGGSEPGLVDAVVYIDVNRNDVRDPEETFAKTDSTGNFSIAGLIKGKHNLAVEKWAGYAMPQSQLVMVQPYAASAIQLPAKRGAMSQITGRVAFDVNGNGIAVMGWPVYLDENSNNVRDADETTVLTDTHGRYAFDGLSDSLWHVRVDNNADWRTTSPANGEQTVLLVGTQTGVDFGLVASADAQSQPRFTTQPLRQTTARNVYRFENRAVDPGFRPLTFSLSVAPEGMSIDAGTGTVTWTPRLDQVGSQRVMLKVMNDRGGIALQDFQMEVAKPNSSPIITSTPLSTAAVDEIFRYELLAQDAEQPSLEFAFEAAPTGAQIDPNGRIAWTPSTGQQGIQLFAVYVRDGQGGETLQAFEVNVLASRINHPPAFTGSVRSSATVSMPYYATLTADDVDRDALTYALVSGPAGMQVHGDGTIDWTPRPDQLGPHGLRVRVSDDHGGYAERDLFVEVLSTRTNQNPIIESQGPVFAVSRQEYRYDFIASDPDNDPIAFELIHGPAGLSLDPMRGTVRWVPAADQFGPSTVMLRAVDPWGGIAEQSFVINVRSVGGPPAITSIPPTQAAVGTAFLYSVLAMDAQQDPLTFSLLDKPVGMTINAVTGELAWTPTLAQLGPNTIVIQVSDGAGGFATQAFATQVATGVPNQPPVITNTAPMFASVGDLMSYQLTATDPEGSTITYQLRRGPAAISVNSTTGQVTWEPTANDIGTHIVALEAIDAQGAAAVLSFEIEVLAANIAPEIQSVPPSKVTARGLYQYDIIATDQNRDPLTFHLVGGPSGMTVDVFGRVRWQTDVANLGNHTAVVRVSDPRGGTVEQSIGLSVVPDNQPPRVTVIPSQNIVRANSEAVFIEFHLTPVYPTNLVRISAVDDVGVTELMVTANGQPVSLDANGYANFSFRDWGFGSITVVARATDATGNAGTGSRAFAFLPFGDDPIVSTIPAPLVAITSPTDGAKAVGFVDILGTASSENFTSYTLSVRRAADGALAKTIASGTNKILNGVLGTWDTTLLENDEYTLRLEVQDEIYGTTAYEQSVGVSGNFKLGNFRLGFNDMAIPVAGLPITLARTYDTLRNDRNSEMGYGWRLEFRDADLRTSLPKTGLENVGIYSAFKPGTKVYLTLPGGERIGFTFTPDIRVLPGFGGRGLTVATPRFTPDRGVTDTLEVGGGTLIVNENNELTAAGGIPWNPASPDFGGGYTLVQTDGARYRIEGDTGLLLSVTDRNGNSLSFTESGVSSRGLSIEFERDAKGRITKAIDPAGKSIQYVYDARGDLVKVIDREGNITTYVYKTAPAHYLDQVIDPLGRTGVRTNYDANGRLISTVGPDGQTTGITFDPNNDIVRVTDANGHPATYEYDERGNVVTEVDAGGFVTRHAYDEFNNEISTTNALGETTRYSYDSRGLLLSSTNAAGFTTSYTYGVAASIASVTNPLGHSTLYTLDSKGNAVTETDPLGRQTFFAYNPSGQIVSMTDALGNTTNYQYDDAGRTALESDALGIATYFSYDTTGNRTSESRQRTTPSGTEEVVLSYTYDANGNLTRSTDANGASFTNRYDAVGNLITYIDPYGAETKTTYSSNGSPLSIQFADGTIQSIARDPLDQPTGLTSRSGVTTNLTVDSRGRLSSSSMAGGLQRQFGTDGLGRLSTQIDELGRTTQMSFNAAGPGPSEVKNALGQSVRSEYDAAGRLIRSMDTTGRETRYDYDDVGNPTGIQFPTGQRITNAYDSLNRLISRTDETGRTTSYDYDALGRIVAVTDPSGSEVVYRYDELGNLIAERNALGQETHYSYDRMGRVQSIRLPLGQVASFTYDLLGQLKSFTGFDGRSMNLVYDSNGRVIRKTLPGEVIEITRGSNGLPTSFTNNAGTTNTVYDNRDRVVSRTDAGGAAVVYTYDAASRVTSITTADGTTNYAYDALDRYTSVTDTAGQTTHYQYDTAGNLTTTEFPNGITETRTYNDRNWLMAVVQSDTGGVIASYTYTRSANGQLTDVVELGGRHIQYTYDTAGRLISENASGPQITTRTTSYTYDATGNRLSRSDSIDGIILYAYNANGQLVTETRPRQTIQYSYDASGNRTLRDGGANDRADYVWNADGQLIQATITNASGSHLVTYGYDLSGNLVSRTLDGVVTRYLVDTSRGFSRVLREYSVDGTTTAQYVYGNERVSQTQGSTKSFFLNDGESGSRLLTDTTGIVQGGTTYDGYGNVVLTSGTLHPSFFNGEMRDPLTGLDFLRARFYDPSVGQFVSRDPARLSIGDAANSNRYLYAAGDPVNRIDPSGQLSLVELQVAAEIFGYLTAALLVTNTFQYLLHHEMAWKGSLANAGVNVSPLLGLGFELLRVETAFKVPKTGSKKPTSYFNALYAIGEITFGADFFQSTGPLTASSFGGPPVSVGNDDVRLTSPGWVGAKYDTMQGLLVRSGAGIGIGPWSAGFNLIRVGWGVGYTYSNPLEVQFGTVTGLPVPQWLQLEAGFGFAIGYSFSLSNQEDGYRDVQIFQ